MKMKKGFVLTEAAGSNLVVAVGDRADEFSGYVKLNSTGAFIWKLIDKKDMSVDEIAEAMAKEYDIPVSVAKADVSDFEQTLVSAGIAER